MLAAELAPAVAHDRSLAEAGVQVFGCCVDVLVSPAAEVDHYLGAVGQRRTQLLHSHSQVSQLLQTQP